MLHEATFAFEELEAFPGNEVYLDSNFVDGLKNLVQKSYSDLLNADIAEPVLAMIARAEQEQFLDVEIKLAEKERREAAAAVAHKAELEKKAKRVRIAPVEARHAGLTEDELKIVTVPQVAKVWVKEDMAWSMKEEAITQEIELESLGREETDSVIEEEALESIRPRKRKVWSRSRRGRSLNKPWLNADMSEEEWRSSRSVIEKVAVQAETVVSISPTDDGLRISEPDIDQDTPTVPTTPAVPIVPIVSTESAVVEPVEISKRGPLYSTVLNRDGPFTVFMAAPEIIESEADKAYVQLARELRLELKLSRKFVASPRSAFAAYHSGISNVADVLLEFEPDVTADGKITIGVFINYPSTDDGIFYRAKIGEKSMQKIAQDILSKIR